MYTKKISGSIKEGAKLCSCCGLVKIGDGCRACGCWVYTKRANVVQALCWWLFKLFKLYKMKRWHWDQHECSTLLWEPGALLGQQVLSPVYGEDAEGWVMRKKKVSGGLKFICFSGQTETKIYSPNHCMNLFPLNEPYPDSISFLPSCAEPAINWLSLCNSIFP